MALTFHPAEVTSGLTTSWLPITTAWPAVPACSGAIYSVPGLYMIAFDPIYPNAITTFTTRCLPPEATTWWGNPQLAQGTVWSLGPVTCPEMYYTATMSVKDAESTRVGCCPSGYIFLGFEGAQIIGTECISTVTANQTLSFASSIPGVAAGGKSWTSTTSVFPAATFVTAVPVNGYIFNGAGATVTPTATAAVTSSKQEATSSSTQSSIPTSTSSSISNSNPTSNPATTTSSSSTSESPLSTATKVGLGIGIAVGVLGALFFLSAYLLIRHRRKRELERAARGLDLTWANHGRHEMGATPRISAKEFDVGVSEIGGATPKGLGLGLGARWEMGATPKIGGRTRPKTERFELPAGFGNGEEDGRG